jgi:hypothetical protein
MKRITLSYGLAIALLLSVCTLPVTVGFKGCSKQQTEATIQDALDALNSAEANVLAALPNLANDYHQLQSWAIDIKSALDAADSLKAKSLITSFLPLFDKVAGQLGANKKWLALVDISIHVVLNHLPSDAANAPAGKSRSAASSDDDSIITEYRNRVVWGCQYRPEKCKTN